MKFTDITERESTDVELRVARTAALLTGIASLLICVSNMAVPVLMYSGRSDASIFLWKALGPLCHQKYDRSLFILGWQMGLCARCSSMFLLSMLAGIFLTVKPDLALKRRTMYLIALALMVPMLVEIILTLAFNVDFKVNIRILTGGLYGGGAAVFVIQLVHDSGEKLKAFIKNARNRRKP